MKKQALTAAALTAALTFGSVPAAFAISTDDTALGNQTAVTTSEGAASGETTVSVKTVATNIKATVPITMTVAAPAEGGNITPPSNYALVNNSVYPLSVKVKADQKDMTDWTLVADASATGVAANSISLLLTPAGANAIIVGTADSAAWTIDPATTKDGETKGTSCAVTVGGKVSGTSANAGTTTSALKLVYTISPTTPTPAPAPAPTN